MFSLEVLHNAYKQTHVQRLTLNVMNPMMSEAKIIYGEQNLNFPANKILFFFYFFLVTDRKCSGCIIMIINMDNRISMLSSSSWPCLLYSLRTNALRKDMTFAHQLWVKFRVNRTLLPWLTPSLGERLLHIKNLRKDDQNNSFPKIHGNSQIISKRNV